MQRIDVPTAVAAMPAPAPAGVPGFFTAGDPVGGTPATVLSQDWANMVQEELMAPLAAAGIAPSKANHAQLLAAILTLILGNPANIVATKGRIDLAGGLLVVQWGKTAIPAEPSQADYTVADTFKSPFPNTCFGMVGNARGALHVNWGPVSVTFPDTLMTAAGFSVTVDTTDPNTQITQATSVFWIAIGN